MRSIPAREGDGFATATLALLCRVLVAASAYGAAWWIRFSSGWFSVLGRTDVLPAHYLAGLPVAVLAVVVAARASGLPFSSVTRSDPPPLRRTVAAALLATLLLASAALFTRETFQYSRGFLALLGGLLAVLLPVGEHFAAVLSDGWRRKFGPSARILLVGDADAAARFSTCLAASGHPVIIVGRTGGTASAECAVPHLGPVASTAAVARMQKADRVILLDIHSTGDEGAALLGELADGTAEVGIAWSLPRPEGFPDPTVRTVGGFALAYYWESRLRGTGAMLKRLFDALFATVLLLLLSPVLLLLSLLVKLTSRGPLFHGQVRVGLDGRTFTMWKFRTMIPGAEDATGPVFAAPDDPRRTPVGGFLRRFSLDELPQLWNVLRGDMSLVGPRPERPEFVDRFRRTVPGYMLRHSLKAGITGWAQVNGLRGRSSIEERLAFDLEYARRWSFLLDMEILLRTVAQVVLGRNAY